VVSVRGILSIETEHTKKEFGKSDISAGTMISARPGDASVQS